MKKVFAAMIAFCCVATFAPAATILLDGCEDTNYVTATNTGESLVLASSTDKSQGSYSLGVTYNYTAEGAWYKNATIKTTFAAPVDMSQMECMRLDVNVPTANAAFMMTINFADEEGCQARYEDYSLFTVATSGWLTRTYRLSDLHKNRWVAQGRAPNLKKITKIVYHIMNMADLGSAGTFSFKLDNAIFQTQLGIINETVLDGFESYANDTALAAAWVPLSAGTSVNLETANPYAGTKAMKLTTTIETSWTNYSAEYTFGTLQDFSAADYFKVAVFGDSKLAGYDAIAHLYLVDDTGNRALAYMWLWPENAEWTEMFLPFLTEGIEGFLDASWTLEYGGNSLWREDQWDGGAWDANTNLARIQKLWLTVETGSGTATYPLSDVAVTFDDVRVGYQTSSPPSPPPTLTPVPTPTPFGFAAAEQGWTLYE
jgi:hypothetical protein